MPPIDQCEQCGGVCHCTPGKAESNPFLRMLQVSLRGTARTLGLPTQPGVYAVEWRSKSAPHGAPLLYTLTVMSQAGSILHRVHTSINEHGTPYSHYHAPGFPLRHCRLSLQPAQLLPHLHDNGWHTTPMPGAEERTLTRPSGISAQLRVQETPQGYVCGFMPAASEVWHPVQPKAGGLYQTARGAKTGTVIAATQHLRRLLREREKSE